MIVALLSSQESVLDAHCVCQENRSRRYQEVETRLLGALAELKCTRLLTAGRPGFERHVVRQLSHMLEICLVYNASGKRPTQLLQPNQQLITLPSWQCYEDYYNSAAEVLLTYEVRHLLTPPSLRKAKYMELMSYANY